MSSLAVTVVAGVLIFLGIYLSFDYWYERIWSRLLKITEETHAIGKDLFYVKTKEQIIREQFIISGVLALLFFILLWPAVFFGLPVALTVFWYSWRLPKFYLEGIVRPGRIKAFSSQLVDGLTLMANGLKSGLSIPRTLEIVNQEMQNPIKQEFGFVLSENNAGTSIDQAFENLGRRIPSDDVSMFVTTVNLLTESGGNTAEAFQNIAKTIRERIKLQNKITAMTAQGMTSAFIVGALPWGLGAMLYFTDPETMKPLFTTPLGFVILLLICILEGMGFFVILKIVKIRV